ncbi:unnamed protein product [Miscanthus lutarioriparius]|uniref:FHA domain-containing protein n=1 Tax=Miscanthus lutarioriparius TaxID=422564 RepID=A0A811REJ7_9POAL|nr:unnamed protein product [Miscanthus lutarioriparius]
MRSVGKLPGVDNEEHEAGRSLDRRTFKTDPRPRQSKRRFWPPARGAGKGSHLRHELRKGTVSGTHARLEKKGGSLLVTDLDSTNGTYINERRVNPGFPVPIDPGSLLIFGDIHLAMFRVRKMRVEVPTPNEAEGAEQETKTEVVSAAAAEDTATS